MRRKKVEKVCPKCKVKKNIEECFYIGVNKKEGCRSISSYCIECWKSFELEPKRKQERKVVMNRHYAKKVGKTIEQRRQDIDNKRANIKTKSCKVYFSKCLVTGKLHAHKDKVKYFVSNEAYLKYNAYTNKERIRLKNISLQGSEVNRKCINCGIEYNVIKVKKFNSVTCSSKCSVEHKATMRRKRSKIRNDRYGQARQRAKDAGALVHHVERIKIFERDKFKCWICGNKTDKNSIGKCFDNSPTLDHVQPLAYGGSHTANNLKTACFKCNSVRQHRDTFNYQLTI
jgi:5-methylcytosine-specific restriction endonuclease McrA